MDDWFNLTATYKPESDAKVSYHAFGNLDRIHGHSLYLSLFREKYTNDPNFFARGLNKPKKGLALWIVSHCSTSSKREKYILELQKYMQVDVYGSCNSRSIRCDNYKSKGEKDACMKDMFNSYKFYLSFENSNCDHYITEKYWQFYYEKYFFDVNIVPIVRGASINHYGGTTFGHKTHIHVDSFDSPESLADYIHYLDRNNTAYLEYFEWKKESLKRMEKIMKITSENKTFEFFDQPGYEPFCEICAKLHDSNYLNDLNKPSLKISEFYNPKKDCHDGGDTNYFKNFLKNLIGVC